MSTLPLRFDGRVWDEPREATIDPSFQKFAEGSALIAVGSTKVLCAASVEDQVPPFMRGQGKGWVTAEYNMLPRSTNTRISRDRGHNSGRSQEILRLIGRALRSVINMESLGERTVLIDCDVIQADGGTRTAAITGSYVALYQAIRTLLDEGLLSESPISVPVAAISVGLVDGVLMLDLCYEEDSKAQVDFNIVSTENGELVELQGATEAAPFPRHRVAEVLALASRGMEYLFNKQRAAIQQI